jgi:MFS family permease
MSALLLSSTRHRTDGWRRGKVTPRLVVEGAGTGLALAPLASTVLARVPPDRAGSAPGLLTTALQVGNAIGVAIIGVVFYHALGHSADRTGYAHAFRTSLGYLVAVALFLAAVVRLLPAAPTDRETPAGQEARTDQKT